METIKWKKSGKRLRIIPSYYISNFGRVLGKSGRILLGGKNTKGYPHVCIFDTCGKQRTPRVHRLVAEHFIPNPENKLQVNHIDADKENNHVSNLEWVSNAENHAHKMKMGLNVSPVGEASGRNKLTEDEAVYIYRSQSSGTSLAKQFNVSTSTISSIKSGRNWKHATEGLKKIG